MDNRKRESAGQVSSSKVRKIANHKVAAKSPVAQVGSTGDEVCSKASAKGAGEQSAIAPVIEEQSSTLSAPSLALPEFAGDVFKRPQNFKPNAAADVVLDDYTVHAYQYATSSRPEFCQPAAIICAATEDDIKLAINYAREAGVGLAIRSGGHEFWGYSSTSGANIQLDLKPGFHSINFDETSKILTAQVGAELNAVTETLGKHHAFVPHGQCGSVCVGGHMQTGGYSVLGGRSFGFFIDHITQFRVITADLQTHIVVKPTKGTSQDNDDLWFAFLGGSPGNLGVVTELCIQPLFDADHPNSLCCSIAMTYSKEAMQACLDFVATHNDNDELAADFNVSTNILAGSQILHHNIDTKMAKEHPELYGPPMPPHPTVITLFAMWANLDGQDITKDAREFFASMDKVTKPYQLGKLEEKILEFLMKFYPLSAIPVHVSAKTPLPISKLSKMFCFPARVEPNPYASGTWCGQRMDLKSNGFVEWATESTDFLTKASGCYPTLEWCVSGGKYSKMLTNAQTNPTALAHRDIKMLLFLYVHYSNTSTFGKASPKAGQTAEKWVEDVAEKAVGENGLVGTDRRWFAFPNSNEAGNLDKDWEHYFNSKADYDRVLALKRKIDPHNVFTPNLFCIGASECDRFK